MTKPIYDFLKHALGPDVDILDPMATVLLRDVLHRVSYNPAPWNGDISPSFDDFVEGWGCPPDAAQGENSDVKVIVRHALSVLALMRPEDIKEELRVPHYFVREAIRAEADTPWRDMVMAELEWPTNIRFVWMEVASYV